MRESKSELPDLPIYQSKPPEWLPKVSTSADLGFIGFHPPYPGQPEDILSEPHIKNGFSIGHAISAETYTSVDTINQKLREEDVLSDLDDFMNQIFARRIDNLPQIPSTSSFRMPIRVTLNDSKRQAWFADLADPNVPLHKLGKSVPHGAKGHDLLDLLQTNNVAIPRAVWFLRVFGANETAGLRNKPSYNPTHYSVEWANVVTSYIKKQLADIALPTAPRPGLNIKTTFKGVLSDAETRDRWISRFSYCLDLLRTFYTEGLVDNRTFLSWLVNQLATCNLAQGGFVTRLAEEYLDGMSVCRALMRPFVDACLGRIHEIRTTVTGGCLAGLEGSLKILLQRVSLAHPDAFISPRTWSTHFDLITEILTQYHGPPTNNIDNHSNNLETSSPSESDTTMSSTETQSQAVLFEMMKDCYWDVKIRNEALLFRNLPMRDPASLGSAVSDVQLLNSISANTDLETLNYFPTDHSAHPSPSFTHKLRLLLSWCITPLQYGDHRPYVVSTLLTRWLKRASRRTTHSDSIDTDTNSTNTSGAGSAPARILQDELFDWLDTCECTCVEGVARLFGELGKNGLWSFDEYLGRLISRGEIGLSNLEEPTSRHRDFLRWIPLSKATSALMNQRRLTLYGARVRDIPEDIKEKEIRKEIRALFPQVFDGEAESVCASPREVIDKCPVLFSACRFEQVRCVTQWFMPLLRKHLLSQEAFAASSKVLTTYCTAVALFELLKFYECVLEISLLVLEQIPTIAMLTAVLETLRRLTTIWACMNATGSICTALHTAHQFWRQQGIQTRALMTLLIEMDNGRHLDQASRDHVVGDLTAFAHALFPGTNAPEVVPPVLPEILLLAEDPSPDAPSLLANSLWYKYRTSPDWAWKVWDNTVASLRQIPMMLQDLAGRRACALRYGAFLLHVDQHLPHGMNEQVLKWCLGSGRNEVAALNADSWDIMTVVLLYLCVQGALTETTILEGLVYPGWNLGAAASSVDQVQSLGVFLRAANDLFEGLLLLEGNSTNGVPPMDLFDVQRLGTRRKQVYQEPHFSLLVASIPTLVVIEQNKHIPEQIRSSCRTLRQAVSGGTDFRQAAYRNLDTVRLAFEKSMDSETVSHSLRDPLFDALRLVLEDTETASTPPFGGDKTVSSLISPWKLTATAIELKFTMRQISEGLSNDSTRDTANSTLERLTASVFDRSMTSEETNLVSVLATGVGPLVCGKFLNTGLRCISQALASLTPQLSASELSGFQSRAGEILRVLAFILRSSTEDGTASPEMDSHVQDELFSALCGKLEATHSSMTSDGDARLANSSQMTQFAILLARILQFGLRCRGRWISSARGFGSRIIDVIFRMALFYLAGASLDIVAHSVLMDTLYYILDEIPLDTKSVTPDYFRYYPQFSFSEIAHDIPREYQPPIRSLLPYVSTTHSVANLACGPRDATSLSQFIPVQNRPWDWVEHLGDNPAADPKEEEKERQEKERTKAKYLVKNTTSLSLELFGAHMTGDGILQCEDPRIESDMRSFEDGLTSESIFKRDWRDTRMYSRDGGSHVKGEDDDDVMGLQSLSAATQRKTERHSASRRGSPASSVVSRSSAHGGPSAFRNSPAPGPSSLKRSGSTASEPIDVDNLNIPTSSTRRTSKRTASSAKLSDDDEVEIIEMPSTSAPKASKKPKSKAPTRGRGKKR
ncbi:hypothetical protein JAAARDRAFT_42784 [Jaapia argillacea MUCL 33604]|uniref:Mediator of RNA polymerase II transcription subunit 12 n=1 Tax=Jaapia argillacea MUCL 33604 TaxID=933084 RepID=A0A067P6W2_9AGAM|nr:hypothetical protein JAAARDRAFT_42784 [Jaapia argillacea MUCL 33604]